MNHWKSDIIKEILGNDVPEDKLQEGYELLVKKLV